MKSEKFIQVFWQSPKNTNEGDFDNFGDILSKYIVEYFTEAEIVWKRPSDVKWYHKNKTVYLTAGSIASKANKYAVIWGSGLKEHYFKVKKVKKILAVRGPKTREILTNHGFTVPEIYGDPALLCPRIFPLIKSPKYIGIIPHYVDYDEVRDSFIDEDNYKVIDLKNPVESVVKEIIQCEVVLSSSLHGLIVPHAYGIPALQVIFSERISGDGVKYLDYFESLQIPIYKPLSVDLSLPKSVLIQNFEDFIKEHNGNSLPDPRILENTVKGLISVCPFNHKCR